MESSSRPRSARRSPIWWRTVSPASISRRSGLHGSRSSPPGRSDRAPDLSLRSAWRGSLRELQFAAARGHPGMRMLRRSLTFAPGAPPAPPDPPRSGEGATDRAPIARVGAPPCRYQAGRWPRTSGARREPGPSDPSRESAERSPVGATRRETAERSPARAPARLKGERAAPHAGVWASEYNSPRGRHASAGPLPRPRPRPREGGALGGFGGPGARLPEPEHARRRAPVRRTGRVPMAVLVGDGTADDV